MVKTRGHRVELDEVELALSNHPDVQEAAAYTVPDEQGSSRVLAAVSLHDAADAGESDLMRQARSQLPNYAVPQAIAVVDKLPRTSTGKIDRQRLAAAYVQGEET